MKLNTCLICTAIRPSSKSSNFDMHSNYAKHGRFSSAFLPCTSLAEYHLFRRVIGTLLGSIDGGVVTVTNCYKVPHKEQVRGGVEEVAINMEFNENLFRLHKKVAPQEIIVGWFTTSKRQFFQLHKFLSSNSLKKIARSSLIF